MTTFECPYDELAAFAIDRGFDRDYTLPATSTLVTAAYLQLYREARRWPLLVVTRAAILRRAMTLASADKPPKRGTQP